MDRLLVVSNRLPITLKKQNDEWISSMSSGGLVSALSGLKKMTSFIWIGWPGKSISIFPSLTLEWLLSHGMQVDRLHRVNG